jgi:hypothetical protein
MPSSRKRSKTKQARARKAHHAQQRTEGSKKATLAHYRARKIAGWSLVVLAVLVGVSHWVGHLGAFHIASPGMEDLLVGYPTAFLLGVLGAFVLSKA